MWRRWIIRGVFLSLLVLCVGGWGWSYWFLDGIERRGSPNAGIRTLNGYLVADYITPGRGSGWFCWQRSVRDLGDPYYALWGEFGFKTTSFLGFAVGEVDTYWGKPLPPSSSARRYVQIPLYFPALLSALGVLYVWRKTRVTADFKTAFPVEPVVKHG